MCGGGGGGGGGGCRIRVQGLERTVENELDTGVCVCPD